MRSKINSDRYIEHVIATDPARVKRQQKLQQQRENFAKKQAAQRDRVKLLKEQGNMCPICQNPLELSKSHRDHDHKCCARGCSKCRRGLLCGPCNRTLGWVENGEWLTAAWDYLIDYDASPGFTPNQYRW